MSLPAGIQRTKAPAAPPAPKPARTRTQSGRIKAGLTPEEFFALDSGLPAEATTTARALPTHMQGALVLRCGVNLYPTRTAWQSACAQAKRPNAEHCACQQHQEET